MDDDNEKQYPESAFATRFTATTKGGKELTGSANVDHPSRLTTHLVALTSTWILLLCSMTTSDGQHVFIRVGTGALDRAVEFAKAEENESDGKEELVLI
jgi:hypothetical protein